jgi:hypothetical protein
MKDAGLEPSGSNGQSVPLQDEQRFWNMHFLSQCTISKKGENLLRIAFYQASLSSCPTFNLIGGGIENENQV